MKTGILFTFWIMLSLAIPSGLSAADLPDSVDDLRKEITDKLNSRYQQCFGTEEKIEDVEIEFLINARNELVILYVNGNSARACEFVKRVLNYSRVKYRQTRQLTPYSINIKLSNPCD